MTWYSMFVWLVQSAIASTVLLGLAAIGVRLCRSPADRVRIIQCGLAAACIAMLVCAVPQLRLVTVPVLDASSPAPAVVAATEQPSVPITTDRVLREGSPALAPEPIVTIAGQGVTHSLPSAAPAGGDGIEATPATKRSFVDYLVRGVCIAYLVGVAVLLLRWCVARWGLVRLQRLAQPASPSLQSELVRIDPRARRVRLLVSDRVSAPITWGTLRPVIILPTAAIGDVARLRYYLAHEWAHVVRRDAATWQLATIVQAIFFYQPLVHWLRHQLSLGMDQLADTHAAEQGESSSDYAELLIGLAKLRLGGTPLLTLGIVDRRSALYQRVTFLLREAASARRSTSVRRTLAMVAIAAVVTLTVSSVRLDARDAADSQPETPAVENKEEPKHDPAPDEKPQVEPITYSGVVIDAATKKPIEGVTVLVYHKLSRDPKTGGWSDIETTEHVTNAEGVYSFTLPPEQVAESSLYLEVDTRHPKYAPKGRSGYAHSMILKNLELGEAPFYSKISLWPGEEVTARVVDPEGNPLKGIEIRTYSAAEKATGFIRGSFDKATTDADGRFSIVIATPGDGVLWITPDDYSPQAHRLKNRRGDWGTIEVERDVDVKGRLLDAEGKPFGNVRVEACRRGDGEEADEFLQANAVANGIMRRISVGESGEFTLASLPDGTYNLEVERDSIRYDPIPLEEVFLRQTFTVENGKAEPLTIRAVPYVVLSGTYLNSKGEPCSGHSIWIIGRMNGEFYSASSSTPQKDGKFTLKIPHGLEQAELDPITNEHSALRWRMSPEGELDFGRRFKLGTVEDDISGFEVVRYTAPILLAKPVDEEGNLLAGCEPVLTYVSAAEKELTVYVTGSHISFEQQTDGRHRSSQLLPDEPFKITMKKEGYTAEEVELSLAEGETRDVTITLKKSAESETPAE